MDIRNTSRKEELIREIINEIIEQYGALSITVDNNHVMVQHYMRKEDIIKVTYDNTFTLRTSGTFIYFRMFRGEEIRDVEIAYLVYDETVYPESKHIMCIDEVREVVKNEIKDIRSIRVTTYYEGVKTIIEIDVNPRLSEVEKTKGVRNSKIEHWFNR